uniref:Nad3 n=1 Tax=Neorotalia gaimardi TaxID=2855197 RepID=UPI0023F44AB9|nr:Nad3 [Neorotalia gaimardi]WEF49967.1 Nad3 [Neorotalia gaimardi]
MSFILLSLVLISIIYCSLLFLLSLIPSMNLCLVSFSSISNNFECGFYSIICSSLRYRFNYWLILFHFLISEQELIIAPLLVYGLQTLTSNWIIIILYLISFIDLLIYGLQTLTSNWIIIILY